MSLTVTIPVKTTNPLNGSHRHWSVRAKARKAQRSMTRASLLASRPWVRSDGVCVSGCPALPCVVLLTRVAPSRGLDDDALPAALKSIRDGVADWLGLSDDRDARVRWQYDQRRGKPRGDGLTLGGYGVEIEIRTMTAEERRVYGVEAA